MDLLKIKSELFNEDMYKDWRKYMKRLQSKKYRIDVNNFLNNIQNTVIVDDKITRTFLGSFTMMKFEMFDRNDTWDSKLYYITKDLHSSFENVFLDSKKFGKELKNYINFFERWKKRDEKILVDKSCTQQYKQIQIMENQFKDGTTPDEQQLSRSSSMLKQKFETRIRQIGGERTMKYVNDSPQLQPMDIMHLDMEEQMKKAYWDMFEENVNNNNLGEITKNIGDFKKYLFELLGNSNKAKTIKQKFEEEMDIDLLDQMIHNGNMSCEEIYGIMRTLCWYVKTYIHAADEDEDTEMFLNNIYKKMEENKQTLGEILRYFFQNIFIKLDKTKLKIELLKI